MNDYLELVAVRDLRGGDEVDLESDPYANAPCAYEIATGNTCEDRREDGGHWITWTYEFGEVSEVVAETPECVRVDFTNGPSIGFPPEHRVARVRKG